MTRVSDAGSRGTRSDDTTGARAPEAVITARRSGTAASVVRIIPVAYSPKTVMAPKLTAASAMTLAAMLPRPWKCGSYL
ncbi:hypothetical protein AB0D54_24080 [Streptomyces xanthophaeus]|uniref:hypothetical protein n=1 Tax=Streptomyces xanthophaeus TaxID=67385 RepID=UPI00344A83CF